LEKIELDGIEGVQKAITKINLLTEFNIKLPQIFGICGRNKHMAYS